MNFSQLSQQRVHPYYYRGVDTLRLAAILTIRHLYILAISVRWTRSD